MSLKRSPVDEDVKEAGIAGQPLKRIRGGGPYGDGEFPDTELFDEDYEELEEPPMPEQNENGADNDEDAAILYKDLSDTLRNRWSRPPVPTEAMNVDDTDCNLQWLDIDMIGGEPLKSNPNPKKEVVGSSTGQVPIIRLFGVNETGNSVAVFIHGFTPYGYFALPAGYEFDGTEENLGEIRNILNSRLQQASKRGDAKDGSYCHGVSYESNKKSIMGYDTPHTRFFKVLVAMPTMVPTLKRIMEDGIELPGVHPGSNAPARNAWSDEGQNAVYQPFECNVPFCLRFMIDRDITGAGWLTLPKGTYRIRTDENKKATRSQVCTQLRLATVLRFSQVS